MFSPTWTPDALSAEQRPYEGRCWRLVEAQHRVATLKLTDTLDEQAVLEGLVEAAKPPVPAECRHLHYLLSTPFRYRTPHNGSRFRRPGQVEGVYYAAEHPDGAVAEMVFYRLLFFAESPDTPWPANAAEYTAFAADLATDRALDLTAPPFAEGRAAWTHPTDYGACQALADTARAAETAVIRHESARDPEGRANVAVLACSAFATTEPVARQTWRIHLNATGGHAVCEFPDRCLAFPVTVFANDPRLAPLTRHKP